MSKVLEALTDENYNPLPDVLDELAKEGEDDGNSRCSTDNSNINDI